MVLGGKLMRSFFRIFFLLCMVSFFAFEAGAANPGPLTYTQSSTLNFGNVTKQNGSDITSTIAVSSASRGQILIKDGNGSNEKINITVQSCGLTSGVKVQDFSMQYGTGGGAITWSVSGDGPYTKTGLANPANNGTQLRIGATVLVTKDALTGPITPCYTITMQYDCVPATCTNAPLVDNEIANVLVVGFPIVLTDVDTMDFGPVTKPTINSTVIMGTDGSMSVGSGNTVLVNGNSGTAGEFTLTAEKNVSISISIPNGTLASGMRLTNMMASLNNGSATSVTTGPTFTTNGTGTNNLKVGGTLTVQTSVTNGSKNVPYTMTINYQ